MLLRKVENIKQVHRPPAVFKRKENLQVQIQDLFIRCLHTVIMLCHEQNALDFIDIQTFTRSIEREKRINIESSSSKHCTFN